MADRRGFLVPLIIICWIVLAPNANRTPAGPDEGHRIEAAIAHEQHALAVVQNSTWEPALGLNDEHGATTYNVSGWEPDRGYAWASFGKIQERARQQLEYALGEWGLKTLESAAEEPNPTPLYANATGHVSGRWQRSKLHADIPIPQLNLSRFAYPGPFGQQSVPDSFSRNITGTSGQIAIRLNEEYPLANKALENVTGRITEMSLQMQLTDEYSYDEYELKLRGVHFIDLGQAILTTTSAKFAGIFMLPHLALSHRTFDIARTMLNETLTRTIQRQISGKTESLNPWASTSDGALEGYAATQCELIMYLQQMSPVTTRDYSTSVVSFLEHELRFPSGAIPPPAPDLRFSMLAFSPDCGFVLESQGPPDGIREEGNHLVGPKMEVEFQHGRHHLLLYSITLGLQLFLLMRQMHEASTPSTRSRISFYTIAALALGDGFTAMVFLLISFFISGLSINLVATGYLAFINVSSFGMRFLMDIWAVQAPERARRAREQAEEQRRRQEEAERTRRRDHAAQSPGQTPSPPAIETRPQTDTLPTPVTAATRPTLPIDTGATPVFMPSDQLDLEPVLEPDTAATPGSNPTGGAAAAAEARIPSFASLYTRFYLLLLALLFLSLNATSWPPPLSRAFFTLQGLAYLSFWLPQIYRNVQRNCRHALKWEFVAGQSILRLVPFVYFYAYRDNILFADPDLRGLALLVLWVWIQVLLLASQNLVGPRWFWLGRAPPAFDYHPILREDEEGGGIGMPIGFSEAAAAAASTPSTPIVERGVAPNFERRPSSISLKEQPSSTSSSRNKGKRIFDCAICMQDLEVPVITAGSGSTSAAAASAEAVLGSAGGLLARRNYMVTPCRHIFHSACLEGWMKYRLQCPICRETLPPL